MKDFCFNFFFFTSRRIAKYGATKAGAASEDRSNRIRLIRNGSVGYGTAKREQLSRVG